MIKKALSFCLSLAAIAGAGCTQTQNVAANNKHAYRSTNYTQVGSHIPGNFRDYNSGDDLSQSEQQRDQFQRMQASGGTSLMGHDAGGTR